MLVMPVMLAILSMLGFVCRCCWGRPFPRVKTSPACVSEKSTMIWGRLSDSQEDF